MNFIIPARLRKLAFLVIILSGPLHKVTGQTYCNPTGPGCQSTGAGNNAAITGVIVTGGITNFNNPSTCPTFPSIYTYYNTISASANPGSSISVTAGGILPDARYAIWIDWTQDGDFDDAEESIISDIGTVSVNFTVPTWAVSGTTRLRVGSGMMTGYSSTPCAAGSGGEVEDYDFIVIPVTTTCSGAPTPGTALATPDTVYSWATITMLTVNNNTLGSGITYQWQSSINAGTTWNNINGATSPFYSIAQAITTDYRVRVSCGTNTATTAPVTVTRIILPDSVWPGDANNDNMVDNLDPLQVALGYGLSGDARPNADTSWTPQYCNEWIDTFANGLNCKYADCDGDGDITSSDLDAIAAHYSMTHYKGDIKHAAKVTGLPNLYFDLNGISFTPGTTVNVPVKFGDAANQVNDIYGLAARIKIYGITPVNEPAFTTGTTWLGTSSNTLQFTKVIDNNILDIAYARTDHANISGHGLLGTLSFDIPAGTTAPVTLGFDRVMVINSAGTELTDYNVIGDSTLAVSNVNVQLVKAEITPNPSAGQAILQYVTSYSDVVSVKVYDLTGRVVFSQAITTPAGTHQLDLPGHIAPGPYTIKVAMADSPATTSIRWIKL